MVDAQIVLAGVLAFTFMIIGSIVSTLITMPLIGSLVRLRANYNPRAVGLDDTENTVGPKLTGLIDTTKRVYRLEGWYGLWKGAYFNIAHLVLLSFCSIIFVGTQAVKNNKGAYSFPKEAGVRMALFALSMAFVTLPMTILTNRAVITPYRLPMDLRKTFNILLSVHERSRPWSLYLTPGLLAGVALHTFFVVVVAGLWQILLFGKEGPTKVAVWRLVVVVIFQAISTLWIAPVDIIVTKLSVQPNLGGQISVEDPEGDIPEGLRFAGQGEDVVGLRPTTDPYLGFVDAARKINEEEGWPALYRGWWFTTLAALFHIR